MDLEVPCSIQGGGTITNKGLGENEPSSKSDKIARVTFGVTRGGFAFCFPPRFFSVVYSLQRGEPDMRMILTVVAASFLGACATVANETRVPLDFTAREFNSISSRYEARPTFARVQSMSSGSEILRLEMDQYGSTAYQYHGAEIRHTIPFRRAEASDYIVAVDRYLAWEETARERGDVLDRRDINRVPAFNDGAIRFSIYSGNQAEHFLMLTYCAMGTCLEGDSLFLNRGGATGLRSLLERWRDGELAGADLDAIYN